ncbi:hypothetical protein L249_8021 [Ophiocordyceps polyrhachis-furcata BCC 54312]|uniref:SAM-dependent MTase RsmB/NOP-type domain-containing protein n=1 Tax=Ophiocordyceps polyrhachis-furcata BCC 54312 TaxID=1330021 RepID=A0A367LHB0_9HYPO|nr:hypothetical protein L249_8021 [Ophiocordyceps polyrhachis-furcata BCC 54312]
MGRKGFRGKNRRGGGGGQSRGSGSWRDYSHMVKENEKLMSYYNSLLQLPEPEAQLFWDALRRELPNSFRFCGSKGHALAVKRLLKTRYIPEIVKIEKEDGTPVEAPMPVPWYPDELAWWMTTPKNVVRKFPPFAAFQKFLVSETSIGNISRQEVVSMIPPLLMDLRPGMTVLDMCAAPGSKSAQLIEMVHRGEEARVRKVLRAFAEEDGLDLGRETQDEIEADLEADPSDNGRATGLLIANDSDYKRCHLLVHQLKRLSSPNLIVTNNDATQFPPLKLPSTDASSKNVYLKFDRILADVPCSGDGTLRKNANLWRDWQPGNALGLHHTQVRILVRALQLLKVGGRVVYSTCSMNPVENESVVASAIERCGGPTNVDIVDCQDQLPALKRRPGLKSWTIMDKAGRTWRSWAEVESFAKEENEGQIPGRVAQTMFSEGQGSDRGLLPLERCMRVYPHLQDTGAFFIAVLGKRAEFKARNENEPKRAAENEDGAVDVKDLPEVKDASEAKGAPEAAAVLTTEESSSVKRDDRVQGTKRPSDATDDDHQAAKRLKAEDEEEKEPDDASKTENGQQNQGSKRPSDATGEEQHAAKRLKTGDGEKTEMDASTSTGDDDGQQKVKKTIKPEEDGKQQANNAAQGGEGDGTDKTKAQMRPPNKTHNAPPEEPFKYLDPSHPIIQNIKHFYRISTRFPDNRYMVRNEMGEPAKAIYYTTALSRDILTENEGRGVRFVHGGVRMFMKQDAPSAEVCRWRIQAEGMPILQGYVGEPRVVHLRNKETLRKLLIEMFPRISGESWRDFDEIGDQVRDVGMGCCVLRIEPDGEDADFSERMALPLWKSIQSLNLMLPKEDRAAMLLRVFNDTTPLINTTLQKQKQQKKKKEEEEKAEEEKAEDEEEGKEGRESADKDVDDDNDAAIEDMPTPEEMMVDQASQQEVTK